VIAHVPRPKPSGWTLDMVVVDDLVYSPVRQGDRTRELVGNPSVLVLPNHFHHLAVRHYRELFPEVTIVASDIARPRLAKQGYADIKPLDAVKLPDGVRLLPCEGVKNGELWMVVERGSEKTLVVCDAFMNVPDVRGFEGFMLRRLRVAPGLRIARTFNWVGIRDNATYRKWAIDTLSREKPDVMMFSHGAPLRDPVQPCIELIEQYVA
jgi:hypothetical protein